MKHLIAWATVAALLLSGCSEASSTDAAATDIAPAAAQEIPTSSESARSRDATTAASDGTVATDYADASGAEKTEKTTTSAPKNIPTERKIIRNGQMEIETADIAKTQKVVYDAVQKLGGYISADNREQGENRITQTFQIKVPFARFDSLVQIVTSHAKYVDELNINSQDVTSEFIDTEARLRNAKVLEARYLQYLRESKNQKETLEVERELSNLRSEIESAEGRLRLLQNQTSYSELRLAAYEPKHSKQRLGGKFVDALVGGWDFLVGLVLVVFQIWPIILLGSLAFWGIRRWQKK